MALLDDILRLLGTNRTRMQWKLRAWQRAWERRKAAFANRTAAPTVQHRARRAAALLWGADTPVVTSALAISFVTIYAITIVWGKQIGVAAPPMMPSSLALWRFGSEYSIDIQAGQWWRLDDLEVLLQVEQQGQSAAHHALVLGEQYLDQETSSFTGASPTGASSGSVTVRR